MKKKGFTLVELLVVIAIIAMLLAILMPALSKVRLLAQRLMCGTNITGIGKAMLAYSSDDKYESFPVAGSAGATWNRGIGGIEGENSFEWRNVRFEDTLTNQRVTLNAHLYLLVKYADVPPEQFICPGSDQKKFELNKYNLTEVSPVPTNLTEVWDFGSKDDDAPDGARGKGHQSYSYQLPVKLLSSQTGGVFAVTATSSLMKPIMADRSPFWQDPMGTASTAYLYVWDAANDKVFASSVPAGNATYHQKEGQNVLYADIHAKFEKQANCGVESDNIYTTWGVATLPIDADQAALLSQCGKGASMTEGAEVRISTAIQTDNTYYPRSVDDSYLVSDVDNAGQ
ncbi:MAG: prepilin-type N-terminal cleavage/methylation domain-containing protein [Planctomycetes bacterium]|nr:prepilin-type N-terminal cleavage/methylation domain-containing protein [Planctomycetota bacterium]MBU1517992.1 prepilin-type N-terminal cleavage/methylation domain-containing protein [Planctomycetota bacterium]MBU2458531.1 prepilin-type N-terminal cleavage/methylation domain-containing protein [Planctomycetota bacterium]